MPLLHPLAPPIAMLHSVRDAAEGSLANWSISRNAFLGLLNTVEDAGFTTTHFAEMATANGSASSFSRQVILSFDDCFKHLLDAAVPELVKRRMKAVFYMPTAHIGGYNQWDADKGAARLELMNESDLKELVRLGMEIGSHSHRHLDLRTLSHVEQKEELSRSKQILEAIAGRGVCSFAYPYGHVPAGYQNLLASAGYGYGVGIYQRIETRLALRRFGVYEKDNVATLRQKLSGRYRWMRKMYDVVKRY